MSAGYYGASGSAIHSISKVAGCAREPDIFLLVCDEYVEDLIPHRTEALFLDARSRSPAVTCSERSR